MVSEGNQYILEEVTAGIFSFRHLQTGEILHGSVGPEKEARDLYLGSAGLIGNTAHTLVVFDIGMGCGAQLLALVDFIHSAEASCQKLRIFSFDLEKNGLSALLDAVNHFPTVQRHVQFLKKACEVDKIEATTPNGKSLEWNFISGDFRETVLQPASHEPELKADALFYDFFSPASHPWLWTFELFSKLFFYCQNNTRLVTYSSATCVKAALAAAGWYVGQTIASGKKAKSIVAGGSYEILTEPLPQKFLSTFENSHKPFSEAETDASRALISAALRAHPQFCKKLII